MTEDIDTPSPGPSSPFLLTGPRSVGRQGLNPSMVYHPPTPSDEANRLNRLIGNDNDNDRRWKIEISLLTIWRLIIFILTLTTIILFIDRGAARQGALTFLLIWLFLILLWNLVLIIPFKYLPWRRPNTRIPGLPTIVFQIGTWGCAINEDGEDDEGGEGSKVTRRRRKMLPLIWIADIILGLIPIIITATSWHSTGWWAYLGSRQPVEILLYIVGSFEFVATFLSVFFHIFRNPVLEVGIVFKKKREDGDYRIRLPVDNDRRTAGGTAVSVAA